APASAPESHPPSERQRAPPARASAAPPSPIFRTSVSERPHVRASVSERPPVRASASERTQTHPPSERPVPHRAATDPAGETRASPPSSHERQPILVLIVLAGDRAQVGALEGGPERLSAGGELHPVELSHRCQLGRRPGQKDLVGPHQLLPGEGAD